MPFVPPLPAVSPARPTRRLAGLVLAAAVLPLAVAGCTASGGGGDDAPSTGQSEAPSSAAPAPTLPSNVTPAAIPTKVANDPNDRKNVVMSECAAADGGWGAGGTATNPTKADVAYTITVFFTTTSATTVDSARTKVEVKAGDTVKWSAAKKFTAPKEMLCVLRGVEAG